MEARESDVPVYFVAHPVGGDVPGNLASVRRWFSWLVENVDAAFTVPWIQYLEALDDGNPEHRARGTRDGIACLLRCDGVVLVGGRLTCGMRREARAARARGLEICDLTTIGHGPPLWKHGTDALYRLIGGDLMDWGLACAASRHPSWLDDPVVPPEETPL